MKPNTTKKQLFTEDVEREYDRFVAERRQRELKRAKATRSAVKRCTGPDRSGY